MVRIGGGVYPHIKEEDYYNRGMYRTDKYASETMLNSLMYRLSYYRFDEVMTAYGKPLGYDTVRQYEIGLKGFKLKHFEEAFTSQSWIVRIYRVKKRENRDGLKIRSRFLITFPKSVEEYQEKTEIFNGYKYKFKI